MPCLSLPGCPLQHIHGRIFGRTTHLECLFRYLDILFRSSLIPSRSLKHVELTHKMTWIIWRQSNYNFLSSTYKTMDWAIINVVVTRKTRYKDPHISVRCAFISVERKAPKRLCASLFHNCFQRFLLVRNPENWHLWKTRKPEVKCKKCWRYS